MRPAAVVALAARLLTAFGVTPSGVTGAVDAEGPESPTTLVATTLNV